MTAANRPTVADRYAALIHQSEANLRRSQTLLQQSQTVLEEAQAAIEEARLERTMDAAARRDGSGGHDSSPSRGGPPGAR